MKRLLPLGLLLTFHSFSFASEPAASPGARPAQNAANDADQLDSRDPFAREEPGGRPVTKPSDPLEPMNRAFFKFNDKIYFWVLKPVTAGYKKVAPEPFRQSVKRFFVNARYPVRLVNNVLQGKMKRAGIETARFIVNSTVGIAGLFDPALDEWRLQPHPEDLDQTLGFYRIPPGIYLDWPIFGPSSIRGSVGTFGDSFLSVWSYNGFIMFYSARVTDTVNATSLQLGEYERLKKATFDPYVALRDAYFDNRRHLIED